ncbi:alpha/beta hydrolase [Mycoplasmatota bacterium WC30]
MKKIIAIIVFLAAAGIVAFILYLPQSRDRNEIFYRSLVTYEDVVYKTASGENLTLDILMPSVDVYDTIPVVIYIHGGDFIDGDKFDLTHDSREDTVPKILAAGFAIVSVNYRLLDDENNFPSCIIDVKDSIRYINSVVSTYNFDPDNIGIWGNGAGAYLALTAAYSPSGLYLGESDLRSYSSDVNYVIDLFGPTKMSEIKSVDLMSSTELVTAQDELDVLYGDGVFDIYNLTETDYEVMSTYDPISYVSDDTVPTLIIHGTADTSVNLSQSILLETKLIEYSIPYEFYQILGGEQGLANISDSQTTQVSSYILDYMIDNYSE